MRNQILALLAVFAILGTTFSFGYSIGEYFASERLQKKALAFHCGKLDRDTTAFSWALPSCMIEAEKIAEKAVKGQPTQPPAITVVTGGGK